MRLLRTALPAILLALVSVFPAGAGDSLTPEQKGEIQEIVREYLLENPEVLIESVKAHQARQEEEQLLLRKATLAHAKAALEQNGVSPVIGAPDGDVTIVEFMDYRCGYCKQVFPAVRDLIEKDGNIRYVVKEFPILGPDSVVASRAALAVWRIEPEKYFEYHTALMAARGGMNEKRVLAIAEEVGLDANRVGEEMKSPEITKQIEDTHQLANQLGIRGTPAFVIGGELIPGAVSAEGLRDLVAAARQG
jgi:protein-disulfide isomerase